MTGLVKIAPGKTQSTIRKMRADKSINFGTAPGGRGSVAAGSHASLSCQNGRGAFPVHSRWLLDRSGGVPDVQGNFSGLQGNIPDDPASLPDDRRKLRDRRGNVPDHSGKLPSRPAPFPDGRGNIPDASGKLLNRLGNLKNLENSQNDAIFRDFPLNHQSSTIN